MVIYTEKVDQAYKIKFLPIIKMNKKFKNDKGLHDHEYEHVIQYCIMFALFSVPLFLLVNWFVALLAGAMAHDVLYTVLKPYRKFCEVRAFKKQLKHGGDINFAAKVLSENYKLGITQEEALRLLK